MTTKSVVIRVSWTLLAGLALILSQIGLAAPAPIAELTLSYQKAAPKQMPDGGRLLARCKYLGSGDGQAAGLLAGRVGWDLSEDQSQDDLHPTQFRGFIERDGKRHPFQIIGVFTPEGREPVARWNLSGTIVFDDAMLLPSRHAPVSGYVETGVWRHHYTILESAE